MYSKFTQIFILIFLCSLQLQAQTTDWVATFGSSKEESFVLTGVDALNNIFTVSLYRETITTGGYHIPYRGGDDIFIEKRNSNGDLIWVKSIGTDESEYLRAIAITPDGGIVIGGAFKGVLDADPGSNVFNLTAMSEYDVYVIKLDTDGNFDWAQSYGTPEGNSFLYNLETDKTGNILLSIRFSGALTLQPGVTIVNNDSSISFSCGLVKLNNSGDVKWAYATDFAFVRDIDFDDNNNIYLTGYFHLEVDFDYGPGTFLLKETLSTFGLPLGQDSFIQKLDADGNFIWVKQLKNQYNITTQSIALDSKGNVYTCGVWRGTTGILDFDPGPNVFSVPAIETSDSKQFIHKLDKDGNFEWVNTFGIWYSSFFDEKEGGIVVVDKQDNLYFLGNEHGDGSKSFNFGTETYTPKSRDVLFAKINTSDGSVEQSHLLGGPGFDNVYDANLDSDDKLIVSGSFQNVTDFGFENDSIEFQSEGEGDAFVMKVSFQSLHKGDKDSPLMSVNVFPNPATKAIKIQNNTGDKLTASLVFDQKGRLVLTQDHTTDSLETINITNLSSGMYVILLQTEKEVYRMKFVKK